MIKRRKGNPMMKSQFELIANYNAMMNQKINSRLITLAQDELWQDRGAFFGSILGTLNHLMVGDLLWLRRFDQLSTHPNRFQALIALNNFPVPTKLTEWLYLNKEDFLKNRQALDQIIIQFVAETTESDYLSILNYNNSQGLNFDKPFSLLLMHFFNHQTHHRGQVSTLLAQIDVDIGETDLLLLIADV